MLYGGIPVDRWTKSPELRKKYLLQAEPEIYPYRDALTHVEGDMADKSSIEMRKYQKTYLYPYINLEELMAEPAWLLSLVILRAKVPPADWATFDNQSISAAWGLYRFEECFAQGSILMHVPEFGKLTEFNVDDVHTARALRALLILESQACLIEQRDIDNTRRC